jgi:hypothetical protein
MLPGNRSKPAHYDARSIDWKFNVNERLFGRQSATLRYVPSERDRTFARIVADDRGQVSPGRDHASRLKEMSQCPWTMSSSA